MTTTPESSSFNSQSGPISDFEAGLAAFKEAEFATAIILLEPALDESPSHPLIARAQMGLALSYEKMGETERAVQLCRSLQQNGNAQVQDWATRTLSSLKQRHPELASLNTVEPNTVEANTVQTSSVIGTTPTPAPETAQTGFTPLDETTLPSVTPQNWENPTPTSPSTPSPSSPPPHLSTPPLPTPHSPLSTPHSYSADAHGENPLPTPSLYQPIWKGAGRAQNWKPLGKVNLLKLVGGQIVTAIALYFAVQQVFYWISASYGNALVKTLPRLGFRIVQPGAPTWTESVTILLLLILFFGSRWILDAILTLLHGLKPLSIKELSVYSPETASSLATFCRKAKVPVPTLGLLPTQIPIAFTYGVIPHLSRTVVSQGLLEQLADDEIAAVYANEVGHLKHYTVSLMSVIAVVLQLPYLLYWVTAEWGNGKDSPITKFCASLISISGYGFFWLWRWVPLWLSRQRTYYGDRVAAELTGNPNGYTRALVKLAIGTAKSVQQEGQANYLLEGFEILTPLGYRIATPLGSLYAHTPLENVLNWERTQPLRHWLAINNTHPPTGDRLNLLTLYARHWRLDSELNWQDASLRRQKAGLSTSQWRSLILQGAPYFGVVLGLAIAFLLRFIGWIGLRARWEIVSWMASDRTILIGLPLVGLCVGILVRLNPFFPDLQHKSRKMGETTALPILIANAQATPLHSESVQLEGTLLGRAGISNLFNQDLWLNTPTGMIKLHCASRLGILDSFYPHANRPANLVRSSSFATGWFRRGATPWVDVDTLRTAGGRMNRSQHPTWGFVIAAIAAAYGILAIFNINL